MDIPANFITRIELNGVDVTGTGFFIPKGTVLTIEVEPDPNWGAIEEAWCILHGINQETDCAN